MKRRNLIYLLMLVFVFSISLVSAESKYSIGDQVEFKGSAGSSGVFIEITDIKGDLAFGLLNGEEKVVLKQDNSFKGLFFGWSVPLMSANDVMSDIRAGKQVSLRDMDGSTVTISGVDDKNGLRDVAWTDDAFSNSDSYVDIAWGANTKYSSKSVSYSDYKTRTQEYIPSCVPAISEYEYRCSGNVLEYKSNCDDFFRFMHKCSNGCVITADYRASGVQGPTLEDGSFYSSSDVPDFICEEDLNLNVVPEYVPSDNNNNDIDDDKEEGFNFLPLSIIGLIFAGGFLFLTKAKSIKKPIGLIFLLIVALSIGGIVSSLSIGDNSSFSSDLSLPSDFNGQLYDVHGSGIIEFIDNDLASVFTSSDSRILGVDSVTTQIKKSGLLSFAPLPFASYHAEAVKLTLEIYDNGWQQKRVVYSLGSKDKISDGQKVNFDFLINNVPVGVIKYRFKIDYVNDAGFFSNAKGRTDYSQIYEVNVL